jgi:thiamine biosynthesis protein ThiS
MHITINGERRELAGGPMSIKDLLEELGLDARRVAVEINRRILKRAEFDKVIVSEGDELEVVHFVGGG